MDVTTPNRNVYQPPKSTSTATANLHHPLTYITYTYGCIFSTTSNTQNPQLQGMHDDEHHTLFYWLILLIWSIIRLALALGAIQTMLSSRSPKKASDSERATLPQADHFDFLLGKNCATLDRHAVPVPPVAVTPTSWRPVSHCRHRTKPAYNYARGTGGSASTSWRRAQYEPRRDWDPYCKSSGCSPDAGCVHYYTVHERLLVQVPLCSAVLV